MRLTASACGLFSSISETRAAHPLSQALEVATDQRCREPDNYRTLLPRRIGRPVSFPLEHFRFNLRHNPVAEKRLAHSCLENSSRIAPAPFHRSPTVPKANRFMRALGCGNAGPVGFRSGEHGGRNSNHAPRSLMAASAAATLWAGRLSGTTTSPSSRVGANRVLIQVVRAGPSIGPSGTHGAVMPLWRRPSGEGHCFPVTMGD